MKKPPITITIKPLSETEYDLFVRVGNTGRDKLVLDAHLRAEGRDRPIPWNLDVFDSNKPSLRAHVGTFNEFGCGKNPGWQEVFNVLTDLIKIMEAK